MHKVRWYRRLAHKLGYDLVKFNQQVTLETHLRELMPRLHIDLVIDVGANKGQYAQMLRYIGFEGRIVSLEPGSAAFAELTRAACEDPLWEVHRLALGSADGELKLNISPSSEFSSVYEPSEFGTHKYGESMSRASTETVDVQRLDAFLTEHIPHFPELKVLLKMDTQGHDHEVFAGAGPFARDFALLQSEIAVTPIYQGVPDFMESLALYRSQGYSVTGLYTVNRHRQTGHVVEFDCVMTSAAALPQVERLGSDEAYDKLVD